MTLNSSLDCRRYVGIFVPAWSNHAIFCYCSCAAKPWLLVGLSRSQAFSTIRRRPMPPAHALPAEQNGV